MLQNGALRVIFGSQGEEVTGDWRKLHNEGLHDLYCTPNSMEAIKLNMRWVKHVARMGCFSGEI